MPANAEVQSKTVDPVVFHLTGRRAGDEADRVDGLEPALLAPYRDLTSLRYDFPVVLSDGADGSGLRSLSSIIDDMLQKVAPAGPDSEQLRKMVLRLEREIRTLLAEGASGTLSELWDQACDRLATTLGASFAQTVRIGRGAIDVDGPCVDCDAAAASHIIGRVWQVVQDNKARGFRAIVSRLAVKLEDILRAEFIRSLAGRSAGSLQASLGSPHHALFDFKAMSALLPQASSADALPEGRRRRIEWALWVLKRQRFFAAAAGQSRPVEAAEPYAFRFDNCADAVNAFRGRMADMVELVKAVATAELEIAGRYVEARHDPYFDRFDAASLSPKDIALFPDYLVVVRGPSAADSAGLLDALSTGMPLKIVVTIDDLVEEGAAGNGHFTFGLRSSQLASMATGLGDAFVLQSTSSNLYQMRDRLHAGLSFPGPALFSVFAGIPGSPSLSRYLTSAAAMQSRAFPAFTYDPAAGDDLASRFSLEDNPEADRDWTLQTLEYADDNLQRASEETAFTFVDFLAADPRHARHFVRVARAQWSDKMRPAAEWLARSADVTADRVPYVWAVDADGRLVRAICDDKAIAAARRCLDAWHRLQEFGGINNSHADRLLARERAVWDEQRRRDESLKLATVAATTPVVAAAPVAASAAVPAPAAEAKEPARSPNDAYIETARCSSCNECIQINDKMFVYNDNKQAYVANADAGSYRQLVEAAENCQLGIIHPGKPRNKSEADLDELMKRAAVFA
jgi:ferredoxin